MTPMIEYDLYLPAAQAPKLVELRRELIEHFGGLTDTRQGQEGRWRFGDREFKDQVVVWKILSDRGAEGDAFIEDVRRRLERDLEERQILVIRREVQSLG